ncbi:MAG: ATP-binding protein [Bacteroidota bacterium]
MLRFLITSVLFSLAAIPSIAQPFNKVDSLRNALEQFTKKDTSYIKTLITLGHNIRSVEKEKTIQLFEEAISLSQALSEVKFEIRAYNELGVCYAIHNQSAEAIHYFNAALQLALKNDFPEYAADHYGNIGVVFKNMGDYSTSLSYYAKSLAISDSIDDEDGLANLYDNMGILYDLMKEPQNAMEHYQKALTYWQRQNDQEGIARTNSNIALLYFETSEYQKAIPILEEAMVYFEKQDLKPRIARQKLSLADAYYQLQDYQQAEAILVQASTEIEALKIDDIKITVAIQLAKTWAELKKFPQSIEMARKATTIADSVGSFTLLSNAYEALSIAYEKAGQSQLALDHYKTYKAWQDSIFNEQTAALYKSQQVQMEVAQKDRELASQASELTLLNEQITLENRWKWMLGGASLLLLLAGILYYQKFRARKAYAEQLEARNTLITKQKEEIEATKQQLEATDDTINYFASSLYGKNSVDEILWDVAKNCISRLGLKDCVIYLLDEERQVLVQKAAYGPKNPKDFTIHEPIEIPLGQGVVGTVAQTGQAEVIRDTSQDERYITDDDVRLSELTVPIKHQGKVIGVIDSEHPERNFYTDYHQKALKTITAICASKIAQAQADERTRKAEEARLEAEQIKALDGMKSRFFANISHEFRTPLHLILGPLRTHQDTQIPAHELGMMQRNAQRLLRLVNQLMDLTKLEVGGLQLDYQPADVYAFLREIAEGFLPLAQEKQLTYQVDIPSRRKPLKFDPDKLEKITYNLLSNAIKFTPIQGTVSIHASVEADACLRLSVSDSGLGVPEVLQDKIFDRFYQVDGSNTRAFEGTGIGLALVKELVDLHEGSITLDSAQQQGTTFIVTLPLQEAREESLVEPLTTLQRITPKPIEDETDTLTPHHSDDTLPQLLLVEDNPDLRQYIRSHLSEYFQLEEAVNGNEGLNMATEKVPDIIITDVMMPEMDGVELTQHLKNDARTSHIPVLMLTARDDTQTKRAGFQEGADQYLTKPFEVEELLDRLKNLLKQRDRLREKYSREVTLRPSDITVNDHDAAFMETCLHLVEENLSDSEFSVEHMQQEIGMSRMQLHRKLKALTNQSATEFIRGIRLQKAAQMLEQNGRQVAEVAYDVGFNHLSYFAKSFKEKFGLSPSEYAKSGSETA